MGSGEREVDSGEVAEGGSPRSTAAPSRAAKSTTSPTTKITKHTKEGLIALRESPAETGKAVQLPLKADPVLKARAAK